MVTDADVEAFCATYCTGNEPKPLESLVKAVRNERSKTHDRARDNLRIAAKESKAGKYPFRTAIDEMRSATEHSYAARGMGLDEQDFAGLVKNAVKLANRKTVEQCHAEANREYGTHHTDAINTGESLDLVLAMLSKNGQVPHDDSPKTEVEKFWESSDQLKDLYQFARARLVAPTAMLGCCLATVIAHIPPNIVLPPTVASHASLNLFVALVGESGDMKSGAMSAAADWLKVEPDYAPAKPGSGEGLAKCFAYMQKTGGTYTQIGKQWSVIAQIPEVDTLTATGGRSGSTIMSELRSGWSGERIGLDYAGADKRIVLRQNRYRLCMILGVQPGKAGPLFEDADGGTPQRFVWFSTTDPDTPDEEPDEPAMLDLGRWREPPTAANPNAFMPFDADNERCRTLSEPADKTEFLVLKVPDVARDEIKRTQRAIRRGSANADPLDGHRLLVRLKIAVALMALEGRQHVVTESDWERADVVMKLSDKTRTAVVEKLSSRKLEDNTNRGKLEGARADVAEQTKANRAVKRVANNIFRLLRDKFDGDTARADVRTKIAHRDREYFDEAEALLIEKKLIERTPSDNDGPDGFVLRLAGAEASK